MKTLKLLLPLFLLAGAAFVNHNQPKAKPKGMYIMEGATCAGLQFIDEANVNFINEIGCEPWALRTKWLDDKTFYAVEKEKANPNCPPRVMVYTIISHDGKTLKLKEYWTGWGNLKDEVVVYRKK